MAVKTKAKPAAKSAKGGTSKAKNAASKATAKTEDGPSKRELQKERDAEFTAHIVEARENGEKWGEIASELSITPGKAQFLMMLHLVETGEVSAFEFDNDEELTEVIKEARTAADEYSSWGWIAARTGVSEGKIKRLAEEDGFWEPKTENISIVRAERESDEDEGSTKKVTTKTKTKKATGGKSASKVARAKARAKKDPS